MIKQYVLSILASLVFSNTAIAQNIPPELERYGMVQSTGMISSNPTLPGFFVSQFIRPFLGHDNNLYVNNLYDNGTTQATAYQRIDPNNIYTNLSAITYQNRDLNPCDASTPTNLCYFQNSILYFSTSPNGQYSYYTYIRRRIAGVTANEVVLYQVNNGPLIDQVLFDYESQGYDTDVVSGVGTVVNNQGTALLAIRIQNGLTELVLVDKDGNKETALTTTRQITYSNNAIALDNHGNIFVAFVSQVNFSNSEIYKIKKLQDGTYESTKIGDSNYQFLAKGAFEVVNKLDNPDADGVLFYQNSGQIVGSDGSVLIPGRINTIIGDFSVNDNLDTLYTAYSTVSDKVELYQGTELILEKGNTISGRIVTQILQPQINNNRRISFNVSSSMIGQTTQSLLFAGDLEAPEKLCKVEDVTGRTVQFFPQGGEGYANDLVGNVSGKPMWRKGCGVASLAMLFDYYGLKSLDGNSVTPKNLNIDMYTHKNGIGFFRTEKNIKTADAVWANVAVIMRDAYVNQCTASNTIPVCTQESKSLVSYKEEVEKLDSFLPADEKKIEDEICKGNPVIIVLKKDGGGKHFVLATGYERDNLGNKLYRFNDPGSPTAGKERLYSTVMKKDYPEILGFRRYVQAADPSMIFGTSSDNISFVVTDPNNNRTGYNSISEVRYNEIPNALYYKEGITTPAGIEDDNFEESNRFTHMQSVQNGTYNIQVFGVESGTYRLEFYNHDVDGFINGHHFYTGNITKGEVINFSFEHTDVPLSLTNSRLDIYKAIYLDPKWSKKSDNDRVMLYGKLGNSLTLDGDVKIQIGGSNGVTIDIAKQKFKSYKLKNNLYYKIVSFKDVSMFVSSNGEFWLYFKELNLSNIQRTDWGKIYIKIGTKNGSTEIDLICRKNICLKGNQ